MDTFKLIGFDGAARDLKKLGKSVTRKTRPVIRRAARRVANQIRDAAPVDTGELRDSIKTTVSPTGLSATIEATAEHALAVEAGTRHQPARPYFYRTFTAAEQKILDEINKAVREG